MAKTRSMPASPGTPLSLDAVLKKTPKKGTATPKKINHKDTPRPPKSAAKAFKVTPASSEASPKISKATTTPKLSKGVVTPKPDKTPTTPKNIKSTPVSKQVKVTATPEQLKMIVTPKNAASAATPKQSKSFKASPTKPASTPKQAKTVTPKVLKTPVTHKATSPKAVATPNSTKIVITPKATPKPKLPFIEGVKQSKTLEDSPVLKNTKASKLASFFKSAKGKKDAAEIKKLTEEFGLSSDEFDDSDVDIFDESDDGLVYAQDTTDDEKIEENGVSKIENNDEVEEVTDSKKKNELAVVSKPAKKLKAKSGFKKSETIPTAQEKPLTTLQSISKRRAETEYTFIENGVPKTAKVTETGEIQVIGSVKKPIFDKDTNKVKRELEANGGIAIKSLVAYQANAKTDKKKLFEEEDKGVYLDVKYKLPGFIPTTQRVGSRKLYELTFPEKTPDNASVCLILPDLSHTEADIKDHDYDKQARIWSDILHEKYNLTGKDISKIYTMTQLRREMHTRADKNKFARSYDIFLVDRSIYTLVIYHIGRDFQRGARQPYPLIITADDVPQQIKRSYSLASMDVRPGTCHVALKIGNLTQGANKLTVNLHAAVECLLKNIPGGWRNLKTAFITLDKFVIQLPIYVDFTPKSMIKMVKPEPAPRNIVEDELNTIDSKYRIRIDNGDIKVVDATTGQVVSDPKIYFGDILEDVEDDNVTFVEEEEKDFKAAPLVVKAGKVSAEDNIAPPTKANVENSKPKVNKKRKRTKKSVGPSNKKALKG